MVLSGVTIFFWIAGLFTLVLLLAGIIMAVIWRRRNLIVTRFLNDSKKWETRFWKSKEISTNFNYDNFPYVFDINSCTYDKLNRPLASYRKGNAKPLLFDQDKMKFVYADVKPEEIRDALESEITKQILSGDNLETIMFIVLILLIVCTLGIIGAIFYARPDLTHLTVDLTNSTMQQISENVLKTLGAGVK